MRLIDGDELIKYIPSEEIWSKLAVALAKSVDAVPVIRCKDCRYWNDDGYCNKWDNGPGHPDMRENDFCSFGERREEDE